MSIRHLFLSILGVCLSAASVAAQTITVTQPASAVNAKAANDFATIRFQDPMEMVQNTDLGWHIWSIDQPLPGLTGVAFNQTPTLTSVGSSFFRGVTNATNANLELLQNANPFSAKLGRTGDLFPIDAAVYTRLTFRMCASSGASSRTNFTNTASTGFVTFFNNAGQQGVLGPFITYAGCQIYNLDLSTLTRQTSVLWSGTIVQLGVNPIAISGITLEIDWVTLTAPSTGGGTQTVTWTGGRGDIYLDTNNVATDGNLGMLYRGDSAPPLSSLAINQGSTSGGSFSFDTSALAPGQYFFMVCPNGTSETSTNCRHSAAVNVNGIPTLTLIAPSETGSNDDFATVQLGNAWDFNALTDIDLTQNLASTSIDSAFPAQRPDGTNLGNIRVLKGTPSSGNPGDGYFYTLFFAGSGRGVTKKIDADRYRILTVDMGLPGARDINGGSIVRVVWKTTSEAAENVSEDILLNHRAGVNILDRINVDMKQLLRETGGGLGTAGWTGQIENFRLDPHEFTPVTDFWVKEIKLAAFETIGSTNSYNITWSAADAFTPTGVSAATVSGFYQSANSAGTAPTGSLNPINTCAAVSATTGSCTWNTGSVATGLYYVVLTIADGLNSNTVTSKYPVIVDPSATPKVRMALERSVLNFGGHNTNGQSITLTPPQQVRLTFSGTGSSSTAWTITKAGAETNLFSVTPSSGTGPAVLTVSIPANTGIPNTLNGPLGTVVVNAANADNTPQSIIVNLAMTGTAGNPLGGFDTPAESATLQGSVAVTGWAIDDIGISKVEIFRDRHPSEPASIAHPNGKIFIAVATIVDGARPDIVALFPNAPVNYNAGWGYLMLTRGLVWDGRGPFRLWAEATDIEGHVVTLGSKTVTIDNASAAVPFGAIDSPGQGTTVSGLLPNTGWVLSPGTTVPAGGLLVAVDSVFLSSPVLLQGNTYNMQDRSDITNGFPGFNTTGAGRGNVIDTRVFEDGVHTIGWLVTDAMGRADGVGSRFFKTANASLIATTADARPRLAGSSTAFARLGDRIEDLAVRRSPAAVSFGVGMTPAPVFRRASTALGRSDIRVREMERIVVRPAVADPKASYSAYQVVDGRLRFLPIGSSFDTQDGTLYWLPAPGFIGDFDFVIVKHVDGKDVSQISVRVTVGPSTATLRAGVLAPSLTIASGKDK